MREYFPICFIVTNPMIIWRHWTSIIRRFQLALLAKQCPELQLEYINAPTPSKPAPGIEAYFPDGPYYRFYETHKDDLGRKTFEGLRDSVRVLC